MAPARPADDDIPPLRGPAALSSLLLVHGAGSGPWAFDGWDAAFPGLDLDAVDLHAGLNVPEASMGNYEAAVTCTGLLLPRPLGLVGWSMGGLAAMMASRRLDPAALVLLEPSPPAEVKGEDADADLSPGTFDPQDVYGEFPPGMRARPESALARGERQRGVSVPSLPERTLVVHGDELGDERGPALAARYGCEALHLPGASHWDLVRETAARREIAAWLARAT